MYEELFTPIVTFDGNDKRTFCKKLETDIEIDTFLAGGRVV